MLKKISAWQRILLAIFLGTIIGVVFKEKAMLLAPVGDLFIRAIRMIIVPVIFFSIVHAITRMEDMKMIKRVGIKAGIVYLVCMLMSSLIGVTVTAFISPGNGLLEMQQVVSGAMASTPEAASISKMITNILPDNIFVAFNNGNIVQILVFALIFGFALNLCKEKSKPVAVLVESCFHIIIKIAEIIMKFAPLGVLALVACVAGHYGLRSLLPLLKFVACVYIGCMLVWVFYSLLIAVFLRQSPILFFKKILAPMLMAFTTSSSAATLPVTINCAINELNIDKKLASFLLPLGTSLNLNGLSVYLSAATIFAANAYGIHLSLFQYISIPIIITFTAIGAAAIPGSALIVMGGIQSSLGIPLGTIPLVVAVDRLNDMMQTCTNVAGDLFSTAIIHESEKKNLEQVDGVVQELV